MKRILVPYDFSTVADNALDFACQIAQKTSADEVMMLNVVEHPSESRLKFMGVTQMDPAENIYFTKLVQVVTTKLEEKISNILYPGVNVTHKIQIGTPYNTLEKEVAEEDVEMVVMGSQGAEGVQEFFVGSNAEKVVRTANCPVITIKNKVDIHAIKDLVFASNFHELSDQFVEKLIDFREILDADLKLVKINTPASFTTTRHDRKQMEDFVQKYDIDNFTIDIYNHTNEEEGIVYFAEDMEVDAIAMGTNQRKGFAHFLTGSIAEDVVNHAERPVWTLHLDYKKK